MKTKDCISGTIDGLSLSEIAKKTLLEEFSYYKNNEFKDSDYYIHYMNHLYLQYHALGIVFDI